ncbi:thymidylate synthase [Vibrio phage pVa-21]|nr:thymidylate synthase [Vibrio phage pVa-21]
MKQYLNVAEDIIDNGMEQENRTGVNTLSVFGRDLRVDLLDGFPAPTTKKGFFKGAKVELTWMLKGLTNLEFLHQHGVMFWDQWAIKGEHKVLKPLGELKTSAMLMGKSVNEDLYNAGDIEALEAELGMEVADVVDDRYVEIPPTYEYVLDAVCESFGLGKDDAEKKMMEVFHTHRPLHSGFGITKQEVADANARSMKLPEKVRLKTCEVGDLGPVYGQMIRNFPNSDGTTTDQLQTLVDGLLNNPLSRRHLVDLWCPEMLPDETKSPQENVALGKQALAPCHMLWTFKVLKAKEEDRRKYLDLNYKQFRLDHLKDLVEEEMKVKGGSLSPEQEYEVLLSCVPEYRLNLHTQLRSNDWPAGNPVNFMFYAILCELAAHQTGFIPGELWLTATDAHVYVDQIEGIKEQLTREPYPLPRLRIKAKRANLWDYEPEDFELEGYQCHDTIKFAVAK